MTPDTIRHIARRHGALIADAERDVSRESVHLRFRLPHELHRELTEAALENAESVDALLANVCASARRTLLLAVFSDLAEEDPDHLATHALAYFATRDEAVQWAERLGTRLIWCAHCEDARLAAMRPWDAMLSRRFIVCPECGNKRCPRATHHDNHCTRSNEPGQPGSRYP